MPGGGNIDIFFIDHLNRVYCAKAHLIERLQEVLDHDGFSDLEKAIKETIELLEQQVADMDTIFNLLDLKYTFENCSSMISILDSAFISIQQHDDDPELRDLYIISYMYLAENLETASYKMLEIAGERLDNTRVKQLLSQSAEASKAYRALLLLTTEKYFNS